MAAQTPAPSALRTAPHVAPELTGTQTGPERVPWAGTLGQCAGRARAAAGAGTHALFVGSGQTPASPAPISWETPGRVLPRGLHVSGGPDAAQQGVNDDVRRPGRGQLRKLP
ncbi:hypothetical protein GCM10020295_02600 [Streptomyces cinereospinus]